MAQDSSNVKAYPRPVAALLGWIDCHPRTGWYLSLIFTLNFALNLLDALDVDPFWFAR